MEKQKITYKDLIELEHTELSKRDPLYFERVNEIIEAHENHARHVRRHKSKAFLGSLKNSIYKLLHK